MLLFFPFWIPEMLMEAVSIMSIVLDKSYSSFQKHVEKQN